MKLRGSPVIGDLKRKPKTAAGVMENSKLRAVWRLSMSEVDNRALSQRIGFHLKQLLSEKPERKHSHPSRRRSIQLLIPKMAGIFTRFLWWNFHLLQSLKVSYLKERNYHPFVVTLLTRSIHYFPTTSSLILGPKKFLLVQIVHLLINIPQ